MRDCIRILLAKSGPKGYSFPKFNELRFFIGSDNINITFEPLEENWDEKLAWEQHLNLEEEEYLEYLFENPRYLKVARISVSISEFIQDRSISIVDDRLRSIANTTIGLVEKLSNFQPELVKEYSYKLEDVAGEYCGPTYEFTGVITLNHLMFQVNVINFVLQSLEVTEVFNAKIYTSGLISENPIRTSISPQFLNTNTKVRRLGYLKIFSELIWARKKIPEAFLNKRFEEFSVNYNESLLERKNNKGIILALNGNSAEPYVVLLKEFDFITTINRMVVPTKWLKIYAAMDAELSVKVADPFVLSKFDKLFFMEMILKKDFLYFSVMLEFLSIKKETSVKELISSFQSLLLRRIGAILAAAGYSDNTDELKAMERRVSNWKKAVVYLEHLILPRLNWMADFGLIEMTDDNLIRINEEGERLETEFNSWVDINRGYVGNSEVFLRNYYPAIFSKIYDNKYGEKYSDENIIDVLIKYLNDSFTIFKTLAPNRVTSSQALTYVKYMGYLNEGYCLSESEIVFYLEHQLKNNYIYKYQPRYADGYIQKILIKS